ncbi:sugar ABC transporter substrate-binding protein [Desulfococcaceae bacterium HSG9]|nr:sugar ABC transporter substrate-binding protein [Desulfococcaceae bacterium HSG9]
MLKKSLLTVLAVVICCSPITASDSVAKNVNITICALQDVSAQTALALLHESDFEEKTGITVKANLLEFAPMVQAHKMDFKSGAGRYDLVAVDQPSLGLYVTSKWIEPLESFVKDDSLPGIDRDDIMEALLTPAGTWKGSLYAIPMGSYGVLFGYRTDVLKAAGIEAPKTFQEYYKAAKAVNAPPNIYGTALFAHKGEYLAADMAPFLWAWGAGYINGSDIERDDIPKYHVAWDTPEGLAALKFYARFYREGLVPKDTLKYDHARYTESFQVGKVAMGIMIGEAVGEPMENPDESSIPGKMAYSPIPGKALADGTVSPPTPMIGAHSLAINKDSKHKKEAYMVLQFLTGKGISKDYILRGGKPFRFSHFFDEAYKKYPHMTATRNNMPTGKCRPNIPEYPAVSDIFTTAFHGALSHGGDDKIVEVVMKAAAQKANNKILKPSYPEYYQ